METEQPRAPEPQPSQRRSGNLGGSRNPETEKLSMLLCFPDGNVALHKVGARASLIIACPQSAPEKIGTTPRRSSPALEHQPPSSGRAAPPAWTRGPAAPWLLVPAGAAPRPPRAPPRPEPAQARPSQRLLSAPPEPTKKGAGSARQRRAGGLFLGVHREGGGGADHDKRFVSAQTLSSATGRRY